MEVKDVNLKDPKQIAEYFNQEMKKGRKAKDIEENDFKAKETTIIKKIQREGYKRINKEYIKIDEQPTTNEQIQGQQSLIDIIKVVEVAEEPQEEKKTMIEANTQKEVKTVKKAIKKVEDVQADIKKVGRPQIHLKGSKARVTFEIDKTIIQALRFKKVAEHEITNSYIEQLLLNNISKKYFDMIED